MSTIQYEFAVRMSVTNTNKTQPNLTTYLPIIGIGRAAVNLLIVMVLVLKKNNHGQ